MDSKNKTSQLPTEPHLLVKYYRKDYNNLSAKDLTEELMCGRGCIEKLEKPPQRRNLITIPEVYTKALVVIFGIEDKERQHWADVMADHLGLEPKEKEVFNKSIKEINSLKGLEKKLIGYANRSKGDEQVDGKHIPFLLEYNLLKIGKEISTALNEKIKEDKNTPINELLTIAHKVINDNGITNASIAQRISRASDDRGYKVSISRENADIKNINNGERLPLGYVDAFIDYFKIRDESVKKALLEADEKYPKPKPKPQENPPGGRSTLLRKLGIEKTGNPSSSRSL